MTVRFRSFTAAAAVLLSAASAQAQTGVLTLPPPPGAPALTNDPVEALGRYLRVLAILPRNLDALIGAGRSALAIGDANAAISFFARAQEIAPGNGRIKAGLASALVQMEQPKTALKLFDQAVSLGVPEAEIASDRGLARDLRGETRRAQADYALALRTAPDDETSRRLAVSQAISGDRAAAMATLDPLLRRQDRAGWRVRAFVLALTGDGAGAELAARNAMPQAQAQALMPFFARLPGLRPGEKAAAVHLGQFPSDGRSSGNQVLFAQADDAATPPVGPRSDVPLIPAGVPLGAPASDSLNETLSRAPRRRPGVGGDIAPSPAAALAMRAPASIAAPRPALAAPSSSAGAVLTMPPRPPMRVLTMPPGSTPAARTVLAMPPRPVPVIAVPAAPVAIATLPAQAPPAVARSAPPPVLIVPAAPVAIATLPAQAPPAIARSAPPPVLVVPAAPIAIATLPAMPPPPIPQPAVAPQVAMDVPAAQPIAPAANAPVVETRFGPALAESATAAPQVRLAMAEQIPPAAPAVVPPRPAPKEPAPAATDRPVRVDGVDRPAAKEAKPAKGPAPAKPPAKEQKSAKSASPPEKRASRDEQAGKAKPADADVAPAKARPSETSGGERYWVQVASGANKADLNRAWEKTKTRAPQLLNGRTTYTAPWKASNRLLVGPFKTESEAQGFVNTLGKAGMIGMQFTSRAATKVERLSGN